MRDFDEMLAEDREPEQFKVGGQVFTVRRRAPMRPYMRVLDRLSKPGTREENQAALEAFFRFALVKADRDRFVALLDSDGEDDEDACVTLEQSRQLSDWLSERLSGKVRDSEPSSSSGPEPTGASSNVVSLTPKAAAG